MFCSKICVAYHNPCYLDGFDPGYSTDHGYVSDPLPYGEGGRRAGHMFPPHGGEIGRVGRGGGNEAQALVALDKANNKPVAFSVRTNVMYDGSLDDDSPVHGSAVRYINQTQAQFRN